MSLVVSLRVPDGVVVAADSLSTAQNILEFIAEGIEIECSNCKKKLDGKSFKLPPIAIPFNASSYTQKLFSLNKIFAISFFGQGIINEKSIYYHIKQFETKNNKIENLISIRDRLIEYFENELLLQYPTYKEEDVPENSYILGFHINGFERIKEKPVGITYEVTLGKKNRIQKWDEVGCTIGGEIKVIQKLWDIGKENPNLQFKYGLFSLQDAIDFCKYLINITDSFQRFANEVPTAGGSVDIALLTPFHNFKWIKRKELMKTLEQHNEK